ncbi:nudix hydrolase domain-containing protein, partial [Haematococcus lacustris]
VWAGAALQVLEETGLSIEHLIDPEQFLQASHEGKPFKLFIVSGVDPDTTRFAPLCKGEVGAFAWCYVTELPCSAEEAGQVYMASGGSRQRFFM